MYPVIFLHLDSRAHILRVAIVFLFTQQTITPETVFIKQNDKEVLKVQA
jgi:hypothetical protein